MEQARQSLGRRMWKSGNGKAVAQRATWEGFQFVSFTGFGEVRVQPVGTCTVIARNGSIFATRLMFVLYLPVPCMGRDRHTQRAKNLPRPMGMRLDRMLRSSRHKHAMPALSLAR